MKQPHVHATRPRQEPVPAAFFVGGLTEALVGSLFLAWLLHRRGRAGLRPSSQTRGFQRMLVEQALLGNPPGEDARVNGEHVGVEVSTIGNLTVP